MSTDTQKAIAIVATVILVAIAVVMAALIWRFLATHTTSEIHRPPPPILTRNV